ncbi:AP-3 complex subunit delta-1 [Clonorchis sinensis]|uniref:AP-3 complex subunit delta-1 n=1 Tax=Clonorchis sinensis TaxID=79923 RepID=G7Y372_CLOSI|nr:AP-3 complex subunit delta-1 [Clonorchis sinensis]
MAVTVHTVPLSTKFRSSTVGQLAESCGFTVSRKSTTLLVDSSLWHVCCRKCRKDSAIIVVRLSEWFALREYFAPNTAVRKLCLLTFGRCHFSEGSDNFSPAVMSHHLQRNRSSSKFPSVRLPVHRRLKYSELKKLIALLNCQKTSDSRQPLRMALLAVRGTIERVLDKNMQDLVRGIRNHKNDEVKYISECLEEIKNELKQGSFPSKSNAVSKLIYLQMLGYDISWAMFNTVEVMSSPKFTFKVSVISHCVIILQRIGYLSASQSFRPGSDVLLLATNLIRKDLCSANMYDAGVALSGLSCFMTQDLAMDLYNDVLSLTHVAAFSICTSREFGQTSLTEPLLSPSVDVSPKYTQDPTSAVHLKPLKTSPNVLYFTLRLFDSGDRVQLKKILLTLRVQDIPVLRREFTDQKPIYNKQTTLLNPRNPVYLGGFSVRTLCRIGKQAMLTETLSFIEMDMCCL